MSVRKLSSNWNTQFFVHQDESLFMSTPGVYKTVNKKLVNQISLLLSDHNGLYIKKTKQLVHQSNLVVTRTTRQYKKTPLTHWSYGGDQTVRIIFSALFSSVVVSYQGYQVPLLRKGIYLKSQNINCVTQSWLSTLTLGRNIFETICSEENSFQRHLKMNLLRRETCFIEYSFLQFVTF